MCELLGISVREPVRLRFGWDDFVRRGSRDAGNPDGWGVAYFGRRDVLLLREPKPAAESPMVRLLGQYAPASTQIVSHVRRATRGALALENTQPFVRHLAGRAHVFAHNGYVAQTGPVPDQLFLQPTGDTDSERLFALLLADMKNLWHERHEPPLSARLAALERFALSLRERGAMNFIYCDGETLFAHGHRHTLPGADISNEPGLYVLEREAGDDDVPCVGLACDGGKGPQAMVATMPLDSQPWKPLGAGEIACFEHGRRIIP